MRLKIKKCMGDSKQQHDISHMSTDRSLKRINFIHRPQVHLIFYSILTMDKFTIPSTASKYVVKWLINDLDRAQIDLSESRDKINKGFRDM